MKRRIIETIQQSIDGYVRNSIWLQRLHQTALQFREANKAMPKPLVEFEMVRDSLCDRRFAEGIDDSIDHLFRNFIGPYLVICDELF